MRISTSSHNLFDGDEWVVERWRDVAAHDVDDENSLLLTRFAAGLLLLALGALLIAFY